MAACDQKALASVSTGGRILVMYSHFTIVFGNGKWEIHKGHDAYLYEWFCMWIFGLETRRVYSPMTHREPSE